jgi:hypothetical protein
MAPNDTLLSGTLLTVSQTSEEDPESGFFSSAHAKSHTNLPSYFLSGMKNYIRLMQSNECL